MNVKTAAVGAFALGALSVFAIRNSVAQPPMPSPNPRFQITTGEFIAISQGRGLPQKATFRLDTATGNTSIYISMVATDGTLMEGWEAVKELANKP